LIEHVAEQETGNAQSANGGQNVRNSLALIVVRSFGRCSAPSHENSITCVASNIGLSQIGDLLQTVENENADVRHQTLHQGRRVAP